MAFEWPVEGLSVTVIGDDDKADEAKRLALALIRDRAKLVVVLCAPSGHCSFRRQHETDRQIVE